MSARAPGLSTPPRSLQAAYLRDWMRRDSPAGTRATPSPRIGLTNTGRGP